MPRRSSSAPLVPPSQALSEPAPGDPRSETHLAETHPASLLVRCLEDQPTEPWLFFRRTWHWRWRSHLQVADQVARGLAVLRRTAESAHGPLTVSFYAAQHPDAMTLLWTVLAHGGTAMPRLPTDDGPNEPPAGTLWLQVSEEDPATKEDSATEDAATKDAATNDAAADAPLTHLELPPAAGQLDRRPLQPLTLEDLAGQGSAEIVDLQGRRLPLDVLHRRAAALARSLLAIHQQSRRAKQRPIVCASPRLPPVDLLVVGWVTLLIQGVWILEPLEEAFPPAAAWARPTVLVAAPSEQKALYQGLVDTSKRHRRLESLVLWGPDDTVSLKDAESFEDTEPFESQLWQEMGVETVPFDA